MTRVRASHSERGRSSAFSGGYAAGRRVVHASDTGVKAGFHLSVWPTRSVSIGHFEAGSCLRVKWVFY